MSYLQNNLQNVCFETCDKLRAHDKHMTYTLFALPAMFRFLYSTGVRIEEALFLKNKDVDYKF
ncbi:hypothetical protein FACS189411_10620 [Bacteroidia bacterium]|nr:hypothetical protein FACS189411_10620 [Bacteroidia bacterium]